MFDIEVRDDNSYPGYYVETEKAVACGDKIFMYGGFDDDYHLGYLVYVLDTKSHKWKYDKNAERVFREGHLVVHIGNGNVLVFGGKTSIMDVDEDTDDEDTDNEDTDTDNDDEDTDDEDSDGHVYQRQKPPPYAHSVMLIFNIHEMIWIVPPEFALINCPSTRSRHACCLSSDGSKMYISGGLVDGNVTDELFCYDFIKGDWQGPFKFVNRIDHFITIYKNKVFSVGGLDASMTNVIGTISYFDLNDQTQGEVTVFVDPSYLSFDLLKCNQHYHNTDLNSIIINVSADLHSGGFKINYYDLENLKFVNITKVNDVDYFFYQILWMLSVFWNGMLLLFGTDGVHDSFIAEISMEDLGIPTLTSSSGLHTICQNLFTSQESSDFEIWCFESVDLKLNYQQDEQMQNKVYNFFSVDAADSNNYNELSQLGIKKIKAHKPILLARWPHFRTMMAMGMNESLSNKVFIPEPYAWINALIHYLYVDNLEFIDSTFSLVDYSGLLICSNVYEMNDLWSLLVVEIYNYLNNFLNYLSADDVTCLLNAWINLYVSNEDVLMTKITDILKRHWQKIIKSDVFATMPKPALNKLMEICSPEESINSPEESINLPEEPINSPTASRSSSPLLSPKEPLPLLGYTDRNGYSAFLEPPSRLLSTEDFLTLPELEHL